MHLIAKNPKPELPIHIIQLDKVYVSVEIEHPEFYEPLKQSIKEYGLQHPIVIMYVTWEQYNGWYQSNKSLIPPPDLESFYTVRCGNNRVRIARELGYNSIDSFLCTNLKEASDLCGIERNIQREWIMRNELGNWNK